MTRIRSWIFLLLITLCGNQSLAQDVEMADGLRAEGKIYVVVVIVLLILAAVFLYLMRLDRKLSSLESERNGGE